MPSSTPWGALAWPTAATLTNPPGRSPLVARSYCWTKPRPESSKSACGPGCGRSARWKNVPTTASRPLPLPPLPSSRKPTGSCGYRPEIPCGWPKTSTSRGTSPTCEPIRCTCRSRPFLRLGPVCRAATVPNTSAPNPASMPPNLRVLRRPTRRFAPRVAPLEPPMKRD